jgi:hypothetical protein
MVRRIPDDPSAFADGVVVNIRPIGRAGEARAGFMGTIRSPVAGFGFV